MQVYYHLGACDDSVTYALGAGSLLDLDSKSEYVLTILSKCIDQYTAHRQAGKPDGELDSRLVTIVEGMFERCMKAKQYRQVGSSSAADRSAASSPAAPDPLAQQPRCHGLAFMNARRATAPSTPCPCAPPVSPATHT